MMAFFIYLFAEWFDVLSAMQRCFLIRYLLSNNQSALNMFSRTDWFVFLKIPFLFIDCLFAVIVTIKAANVTTNNGNADDGRLK